ncbi:MAG: hypothetical protein WCC39_03320 [Telluria sp.]
MKMKMKMKMKSKYPTRSEAIAMFCAVAATSALFQIHRSWDTREFIVRLLINTAAVILLWRVRPLIAAQYFHGPREARSRFVWHVAFWVVLAVGLFFFFRMSR